MKLLCQKFILELSSFKTKIPNFVSSWHLVSFHRRNQHEYSFRQGDIGELQIRKCISSFPLEQTHFSRNSRRLL